MGHKAGTNLLALLLAASSMVATHGKIHHSRLDMDDRKLVQMTEAFGFGGDNQGRIELTIKNVSMWSKHEDEYKPNWDNFGFFLWPTEADFALKAQMAISETCVLAMHMNSTLFTFKDPDIQKMLVGHKDSAYFLFEVANEGLYSLYFANCEPDLVVSLDSNIQLYNLYHGKRHYLSEGEAQLETVFWVMFSLFTVISGIWAWYVWKNRSHAHRIHYLMGVLCVSNALSHMCQAAAYHTVERTGSAHGWNIAFYFFMSFNSTLFYVMVVLIGTGWSYTKPLLEDITRRCSLWVVVVLQMVGNVALVVASEESPSARDYVTWQCLLVAGLISWFAVLFPMSWAITNLRVISMTDENVAHKDSLTSLTLFRRFYVFVLLCMLILPFAVYLLLGYKYMWVQYIALHAVVLAFYIWTAVRFRPQQPAAAEDNAYVQLEASDIEQ